MINVKRLKNFSLCWFLSNLLLKVYVYFLLILYTHNHIVRPLVDWETMSLSFLFLDPRLVWLSHWVKKSVTSAASFESGITIANKIVDNIKADTLLNMKCLIKYDIACDYDFVIDKKITFYFKSIWDGSFKDVPYITQMMWISKYQFTHALDRWEGDIQRIEKIRNM